MRIFFDHFQSKTSDLRFEVFRLTLVAQEERGSDWHFTSDECLEQFGGKQASTPTFCNYITYDWMLNASMYCLASVAHLYFLCLEKPQREQTEGLFFIQTVYSVIMVRSTRPNGVVEETTTRTTSFVRYPRKFQKP